MRGSTSLLLPSKPEVAIKGTWATEALKYPPLPLLWALAGHEGECPPAGPPSWVNKWTNRQ